MVRKKKIEVLQTKYQLIINTLSIHLFASSFAKISTLTSLYHSFRLRIQSIITAYTNEKPLYFNHLAFSHLRHHLQISQLSALTSLQIQVLSFAVCNDDSIDNQPFEQILLASYFAKN